MASLKLFGAIFIVLFAVATATTYTTTVTTITTTEDEGSSQQGSRQQCQSEIQRKDLDMCESFLSMEQGSGRLRMIVQRGEHGQEQDQQKQCCQQLQQVRSQCRCAAIEDVVKQQLHGSQSMQSQKMQKVLHKARDLPRSCDWQQPQECSFDLPSSFA